MVIYPPNWRAEGRIKKLDMYYVYVLKSEKDSKLYTGCTKDLNNRLASHKQGKVPATRSRRPLKLIYFEAYLTLTEAFAKERFYKSGTGREVLKKILFITLKDFNMAR